MERENSNNSIKESVEDVDFKIVDKNQNTKDEVFGLLHQYPGNFVQGLFEKHAEDDFLRSDVIVAYDDKNPIGCLMLDRGNNEFLWLAIDKNTKYRKSEVAKKLFYTLTSTTNPEAKFIFNIPTEDAYIAEHPYFSGMNFEQARKMYRAMGLEMNESNRIENFYGQGGHVYHVTWIPKN